MDFLTNLGEGSQFVIQLAIVLICLFMVQERAVSHWGC
ncbi:Uncharacterised protein [Rodentibacter pneumotropicus]|uniref:Uncharacterized protein n=1 Tax=Rodentibacter pneumotropicus TaxID=758 RepID=A0A3S4U7R7_9PAST|nr:Uncharacterised protein [Rodentibacter pneumotropicus]